MGPHEQNSSVVSSFVLTSRHFCIKPRGKKKFLVSESTTK